MSHDLSDPILSRVSNFAVGLVVREEGKGSRILGSGVLASIEGRRGILTCGHVAETYEKLPEIGLVRFVAAGQQRRMIRLFKDAGELVPRIIPRFSGCAASVPLSGHAKFVEAESPDKSAGTDGSLRIYLQPGVAVLRECLVATCMNRREAPSSECLLLG